MNRLLIAVDGPSASGKGTVCTLLSKKYNIPHLNTGSLYRAVAYKGLTLNFDLNNVEKMVEIAKNLNENDITNKNIFVEEIGAKASIVAKLQPVRDALFQYQRNFASNEKGAILDGRDITTVICPDADYKFFITASIEERAKRRYKEMIEKDQNVNYEDIYKKLLERDERDKNRENNPLKISKDVIYIDTTNKPIEKVFEEVDGYIKK